jgi:hypothetical protein
MQRIVIDRLGGLSEPKSKSSLHQQFRMVDVKLERLIMSSHLSSIAYQYYIISYSRRILV